MITVPSPSCGINVTPDLMMIGIVSPVEAE
jgi:hypothetical protein